MEALDPAMEWQRLCEHYHQLTDEELVAIARERSELTDAAQQAVAYVVSQRGLKVEPGEPPPPPIPEPPDTFEEDRKLIDICTVWSLRDALQLQNLLEAAGIPFFMGPEKATAVEAVTSNFVDAVSVQIMQIGMPWARRTMQNYAPQDEPAEEPQEEPSGNLRCPKCHSTEVIFDRLVTEPEPAPDNSTPNYEWTCGSCGHQWEDDGVVED